MLLGLLVSWEGRRLTSAIFGDAHRRLFDAGDASLLMRNIYKLDWAS
jgi:hypothetical protein